MTPVKRIQEHQRLRTGNKCTMSRADERENGGGAAGEMAKVNRVNQSSSSPWLKWFRLNT
jgi:hypothetical protein